MKKNLLMAAVLALFATTAAAADAPRKADKKGAEKAGAGGVELAYDYANLDANKDGYVSPDEMNEHDKKRNAAKADKK